MKVFFFLSLLFVLACVGVSGVPTWNKGSVMYGIDEPVSYMKMDEPLSLYGLNDPVLYNEGNTNPLSFSEIYSNVNVPHMKYGWENTNQEPTSYSQQQQMFSFPSAPATTMPRFLDVGVYSASAPKFTKNGVSYVDVKVASPLYTTPQVNMNYVKQPIVQPHLITQPIINTHYISTPILRRHLVQQPVVRTLISQPVIQPRLIETTQIKNKLLEQTYIQPKIFEQTVIQPKLVETQTQNSPLIQQVLPMSASNLRLLTSGARSAIPLSLKGNWESDVEMRGGESALPLAQQYQIAPLGSKQHQQFQFPTPSLPMPTNTFSSDILYGSPSELNFNVPKLLASKLQQQQQSSLLQQQQQQAASNAAADFSSSVLSSGQQQQLGQQQQSIAGMQQQQQTTISTPSVSLSGLSGLGLDASTTPSQQQQQQSSLSALKKFSALFPNFNENAEFKEPQF